MVKHAASSPPGVRGFVFLGTGLPWNDRRRYRRERPVVPTNSRYQKASLSMVNMQVYSALKAYTQ